MTIERDELETVQAKAETMSRGIMKVGAGVYPVGGPYTAKHINKTISMCNRRGGLLAEGKLVCEPIAGENLSSKKGISMSLNKMLNTGCGVFSMRKRIDEQERENDFRRIALHEAGHTVMARFLGVGIEFVTLNPTIFSLPESPSLKGEISGTAKIADDEEFIDLLFGPFEKVNLFKCDGKLAEAFRLNALISLAGPAIDIISGNFSTECALGDIICVRETIEKFHLPLSMGRRAKAIDKILSTLMYGARKHMELPQLLYAVHAVADALCRQKTLYREGIDKVINEASDTYNTYAGRLSLIDGRRKYEALTAA